VRPSGVLAVERRCAGGSESLGLGFVLRGDVIKLRHKMKGTRERWRGSTYDFYLIAPEPLYVFRKPAEGEDFRDHRHRVTWR